MFTIEHIKEILTEILNV